MEQGLVVSTEWPLVMEQFALLPLPPPPCSRPDGRLDLQQPCEACSAATETRWRRLLGASLQRLHAQFSDALSAGAICDV